MPNSIKDIDNFQAPLAAGTAYTVPLNTKSVIQKFTATSQEAANTRLLTIYKVPPAGAAGATNTIVYQKPIPPGPITDIPELVNQVYPSGYSLQVLVDAGTVIYINASILENT